jgi:hypothetical protein
MSSFSFCSSCVRSRERRFNCDFIYFIKLDFVLFCTFLRLFSLFEIQRWNVSLCDFFYVFFRFRSIIFHLSIVVSIIAKSLSHIIFFHWWSRCDDRDRREEEKSCWKEKKKRSLSCVVSCVCLWIERKWKSRKFWELWSNFDLRKENLTLFLTTRNSINLS